MNTTETNDTPPPRPIEGALLKMRPNWSARILAGAAVLAFPVLCLMAAEAHKARLDIEALKDRVDVTTSAVRDLTHTVNPKADHMVCPKSVSHLADDIDLGAPFTCPNSDDGQCVKTPKGETLFVSVAGARCSAGKL